MCGASAACGGGRGDTTEVIAEVQLSRARASRVAQ